MSALAVWQAEEVQQRLEKIGVPSELVRMSTRGDEILDTPLALIGGKGLFVKELQKGMLVGRADLAVHSMKDVPPEFPKELHLSCILDREDPTDALVSNQYATLDALPQGAIVGSCSLRRRSQLLELRPDLKLLDLRGNVNTRLKKLDEGRFDAIVLASAGLMRLGMHERIKMRFPVETMLPACGQGAIGIECRSDDDGINQILSQLNDADTAARVYCERSLNRKLGGSCQTPIAAYSVLNGDDLFLRAFIGLPDGSQVLRAEATDHRDNATSLGESVGKTLLDAGADSIIKAFSIN